MLHTNFWDCQIFQFCSNVPLNNFDLWFYSISGPSHINLFPTQIMILANLWFSSIGRPPNCKPHTDITKFANLQFYPLGGPLNCKPLTRKQILFGIPSNVNKRKWLLVPPNIRARRKPKQSHVYEQTLVLISFSCNPCCHFHYHP